MPKTRKIRGKLRALTYKDRDKRTAHNERTGHALKKWEKRHVVKPSG